MPRKNLLALIASVAVLALTACTDMTGPSHDGPAPCPITSGGSTCQPT
jgi:hypothetical protein